MDLYLWKPVGGGIIYKMKGFQRKVRVHFICKYVICILGNSDRFIVHQNIFCILPLCWIYYNYCFVGLKNYYIFNIFFKNCGSADSKEYWGIWGRSLMTLSLGASILIVTIYKTRKLKRGLRGLGHFSNCPRVRKLD